jgi:hypothetical protein
MANNTVPLQIVPFPDGTQFIKNDINVSYDIWDPKDSNKTYNHQGIYNISSSSYYDNKTIPYIAFNGSKDSYWKSNTTANDFKFSPSIPPYTTPPYLISTTDKGMSTYQGGGSLGTNYFATTVGGGGKENGSSKQINGEWLQIELPKPMNLFMYSILTPDSQGSLQYFPTEFSLVGSQDGISWFYIDYKNLDSPPKISDRKAISYNLKNPVSYSHYRLIISKMPYGSDMVRINQFNLFGLPVKSEGFVGEINRQYSYYDLYPSINLFTPFRIAEGFSVGDRKSQPFNPERVAEEQRIGIEQPRLSREPFIDPITNDIYFTYALFLILAGTIGFIILKTNK